MSEYNGRHRDPLERRRRRNDEPIPEILGLNFKYVIHQGNTIRIPVYREKKNA